MKSTPGTKSTRGALSTCGAWPTDEAGRPSAGDGAAKRKAGLKECSESLLLLLLLLLLLPRGMQDPEVGASSEPVTSWPRGEVFEGPVGHSSGKSREWTALSSTSLVLWEHWDSRRHRRGIGGGRGGGGVRKK